VGYGGCRTAAGWPAGGLLSGPDHPSHVGHACCRHHCRRSRRLVLPGDIVPHTAIERVIAIFIQLAGAVFLALVIGTVGARLAGGGGGGGRGRCSWRWSAARWVPAWPGSGAGRGADDGELGWARGALRRRRVASRRSSVHRLPALLNPECPHLRTQASHSQTLSLAHVCWRRRVCIIINPPRSAAPHTGMQIGTILNERSAKSLLSIRYREQVVWLDRCAQGIGV